MLICGYPWLTYRSPANKLEPETVYGFTHIQKVRYFC